MHQLDLHLVQSMTEPWTHAAACPAATLSKCFQATGTQVIRRILNPFTVVLHVVLGVPSSSSCALQGMLAMGNGVV